MYKQGNKQKEYGSSSQKKQRLMEQIRRIKSKVGQLHDLQSQIRQISSIVKVQQQQKNSRIHSNKSIDKNRNARNVSLNSNKKIKIYQLKKKLEGRNKQYKDQHVLYLGRLKKQEQILTLITEIDQQIKQQKQLSSELDRLGSSLMSDINRIQQKCNENRNMLKGEHQILTTYQKQKTRKISQIKRLKKIIKKSSENTEPDEDIDYSIQQQSQQFNIRLPLQSSNDKLRFAGKKCSNQNRSNQQEILIQDYELSQQPFYISFKKKQQSKRNSQISPIKLYENNSKFKSLAQVQDQVFELQEKLQKNNKIYQNLLKGLSLVRRGNKNLQASLKHSTMTIQLLKNRVQGLMKTNQQQSRAVIENIQKCQGLYSKLRIKQGERGQIRGKLGIKVQNTRILSILNQQLSLDYQKSFSRIPRLSVISSQCLDIVKRIIGAQNLQRNISIS